MENKYLEIGKRVVVCKEFCKIYYRPLENTKYKNYQWLICIRII